MNRTALVILSALFSFCVSTAALGQAAPATSHTATGVVQSVDASKSSVTLEHEPVKSLNWPAMSMGFKVGDPKLLGKLKKGDKIQFTFVQSGRDYVITSVK
jgi:Cu(I)/Ag(I) efflux system protein CusF